MSCKLECHKPSMTQAHCGRCHVTFGSVSLFDDHLTADKHFKYECKRPEVLNLVEYKEAWYTVEGAALVRDRVERLHR